MLLGINKEKDSVSTPDWRNLRLFALSAMILLVSFSFATILMLLTIEKHQTESLLSRHAVVAGELERRIEQSLRFGKELHKFYGMNDLLETTWEHLESSPGSANRMDVLLADGKIRYSTDPSREGTYPDNRVLNFIRKKSGKSLAFGQGHFLSKSIEDVNGDRSGTVLLFVDDKPVKKAGLRILEESLATGFIFFISGMLLIAVGLHFGKGRERIVLLLLICLCQAGFITERVQAYGDSLQSVHKEKAEILSGLLKSEMEHLLQLGLPLDDLYKVDVLLSRALDRLPEVEEIRITGPDSKILYSSEGSFSSGQRPAAWSADDPYAFSLPLMVDDSVKGRIHSRLSKSVLAKQKRTLYLDAATVALISIFLGSELLAFLGRRKSGRKEKIPGSVDTAVNRIRLMAFFFFFGADIAISFLPLHMASLYQPIMSLPRELVLGLPITVQMIFAALAFLFAGRWSDSRGWQRPFLSGLLLAAAGFCLAGYAWHPFVYLLGMATVGFGYGLTYMAGQNFVVGVSPTASRGVGLSEFYAGCIAGSLCGGTSGALLADRVGYPLVFFLGGVILVLTMVISYYYLRSFFGTSSREKETRPASSLVAFFKDRRVLAVIFCSSLPAAIALVGFMNYFSPIYLNENGVSQSTIGRFFMLYGVCMIYLAPFITRLMSNVIPRLPIIIAGITGSCAFFVFYLWESIAAVGIGILLLGLAATFNATRNAYAINLPVSHKVGEGRAMGTIFFVARLGQVAGPLFFSLLLVSGNLRQSVFIAGMIYLVLTLLFGALTISRRSAAAVKS